MAPYDFDAPDSDAILRSSDEKEFRVHRLILSLASPVFQDMFSVPQPTEPPTQIPIIDVSESSDVLRPFLQHLYPRRPPTISDITMWADLYTIADKYNAEVVMWLLREMLIPRFLGMAPLRVYALASRWGFEEEAKIASGRTLTFNIPEDLHQDDAELMGGGACHRLCLLHSNRREAAQALVANHPLPFLENPPCGCPSPDYTFLAPVLSRRIATTPCLAAEDIYRQGDYPTQCGYACRNAFKNMYRYFNSLQGGISKLPQTI